MSAFFANRANALFWSIRTSSPSITLSIIDRAGTHRDRHARREQSRGRLRAARRPANRASAALGFGFR